MADRFCIRCGRELKQGDRFCPGCGRQVQHTALVTTPEADVPVPSPPHTSPVLTNEGQGQSAIRRFWPYALLAVIVLLVIGSAFGEEGGQETAENVSTEKKAAKSEPPPKPPKLTVSAPSESTTVDADQTTFEVEGTITPASAEVRVNGLSVSTDGGSFAERVSLAPGENTIYITALNGSERVGQTRVVTRKEAAEKPDEDAPKEAAPEDKAPEPEPEPEPAPKPEPVSEPDNELTGLGRVVTMTRAVDGDTIEISPKVDGRTDVRLIGIDTPESSSDCGEQPLADAAERFTARFSGQKVALEFDEERIDPFDRLLAYVYVPSGSMLNEELVAKGLAQVATFPPNTRYESRFIQAQDAASIYGRGVWGLSYEKSLLLEDRGNGIGGGCEAQPEPPATATATAPATATATAAPSTGISPSAGGAPSAGGDIDCDQVDGPIPTPPGDPDGLDGDGDGWACE